MSKLRHISLHDIASVLLESSKTAKPDDSLDAQVDRLLITYEKSSKLAKNEGRDFRMLVRRLLTEENDDDDGDSNNVDKLSMNDIDVDEFANNVARLVENYDSLLEVRTTLVNRAIGFLEKTYDSEVSQSFATSLKENHGLAPEKTELDISDEEFTPPRAARSGPGGVV